MHGYTPRGIDAYPHPNPLPEGDGIWLLPLQGGGWEGDGVNVGDMINGILRIGLLAQVQFALYATA